MITYNDVRQGSRTEDTNVFDVYAYTKMKFKMRQKLTQRYGEARRNTEFFV
jgi:hypothetical protein